MILSDESQINATNEDGQTALHTAAGYGNDPDLITMLLRKGARWDILDKVRANVNVTQLLVVRLLVHVNVPLLV